MLSLFTSNTTGSADRATLAFASPGTARSNNHQRGSTDMY